VLAGAVADQLLQAVAGWHPEGVQLRGRVEEAELLLRGALQFGSKRSDVFAVPDLLCVGVLEAPDHGTVRATILTASVSIRVPSRRSAPRASSGDATVGCSLPGSSTPQSGPFVQVAISCPHEDLAVAPRCEGCDHLDMPMRETS